jgi:hypothetical protein
VAAVKQHNRVGGVQTPRQRNRVALGTGECDIRELIPGCEHLRHIALLFVFLFEQRIEIPTLIAASAALYAAG